MHDIIWSMIMPKVEVIPKSEIDTGGYSFREVIDILTPGIYARPKDPGFKYDVARTKKQLQILRSSAIGAIFSEDVATPMESVRIGDDRDALKTLNSSSVWDTWETSRREVRFHPLAGVAKKSTFGPFFNARNNREDKGNTVSTYFLDKAIEEAGYSVLARFMHTKSFSLNSAYGTLDLFLKTYGGKIETIDLQKSAFDDIRLGIGTAASQTERHTFGISHMLMKDNPDAAFDVNVVGKTISRHGLLPTSGLSLSKLGLLSLFGSKAAMGGRDGALVAHDASMYSRMRMGGIHFMPEVGLDEAITVPNENLYKELQVGCPVRVDQSGVWEMVWDHFSPIVRQALNVEFQAGSLVDCYAGSTANIKRSIKFQDE